MRQKKKYISWLALMVAMVALFPVRGQAEELTLSVADATNITGATSTNSLSSGGFSSLEIGDFTISAVAGSGSKYAPAYYPAYGSFTIYQYNEFEIHFPQSFNSVYVESITLNGEFTDLSEVYFDIDNSREDYVYSDTQSLRFDINGYIQKSLYAFSNSTKLFRVYSIVIKYNGNYTGGDSMIIKAPTFDPASGTRFKKSVTVSMSAEEGCDIYFTADGSSPQVKEENKYTSPITLTSTTTLKAIAVDSEGNMSNTATANYECTTHGIGEGYNPTAPAEPQLPTEPEWKPTLNVISNPVGAGYFNYSFPRQISAGTSINIQAYDNNGFVFKNWELDGVEISGNGYLNYVMPNSDVTLVANYTYKPSNPSEPQVMDVYHPVVMRAVPSGAASFSPGNSFTLAEGSSRSCYAYPVSGFQISKWYVNGVETTASNGYLDIVMGEKAIEIVVALEYAPAPPAGPNENYFNPTTGQMIIDSFEPGYFYKAVQNLVNYNYSNIDHLIVKGVMNNSDFGYITNFSNASTIDLSRTGGLTSLSSYAFQNMKVSSLILPASITSIGSYAFYGCANLASLTIYATVPPTVNSSTFYNFTNSANCTVYVPAESVTLYENANYWKNFTILPITNDAHVLQVNLPAKASDGRYKNNTIELVNLGSGQRQKYVVSDRVVYTFNGLQKDEQYNVYMYSRAGLEIGRIEGVVIPDQDLQVTFENLRELKTITAKVVNPEGTDVTRDVTVEWLKPLADGSTTYLLRGVSLGEIPVGQELICHVTLNENLGSKYSVPEDVRFLVDANTSVCGITLAELPKVTLSGRLTDQDGNAVNNGTVAAVQTLSGRYNKTFTTKTDRKGEWSVEVNRAPLTRLTYSAAECVSKNDTIGAPESGITEMNLGEVALRSIVGARVQYGFTYHAAGEEQKDFFDDYQNVSVTVKNITQNRQHKDLSVAFPQIAVLDENVNAGDELEITVSSRNKSFNTISGNVTLDANCRGEITFDLIGKGGISSSFEMTENPNVVAMLYNTKGELIDKKSYDEAKVKFTALDEGKYTLVTMGESSLMNSVLRLTGFSEAGLTEGRDYTVNTNIEVKNGELTEIGIPEVPAFDASLFSYTLDKGTNVSFNKSSITTGNYLTWSSKVDFRPVYKDGIEDVTLVIDLPEGCDMVENSVIQGVTQIPYILDGNRLRVSLGNKYANQLRFCVVPTVGGTTLNVSGAVQFDYDGKSITQPIGSATAQIKDIEINVPSVTASEKFKVSGTTFPRAEVTVYSGKDVVGTGTVSGTGTFKIDCELNSPVNLTEYPVYAVISTKDGHDYFTGSKSIRYDVNCVKVLAVTMTEGTNTVRFDFEEPDKDNKYYYYTFGAFTFTIEFNSPEKVLDAYLYAHCTNGSVVPMIAEYDESKNIWYASKNFDTGALPVNVSVDFNPVLTAIFDANSYNEKYSAKLDDLKSRMDEVKSEIADIEAEEDAAIAESNASTAQISALVEILTSEDTSEAEFNSALVELLTLVNNEFDSSSLEVDTNREYTESEIDTLLEAGESLLNNDDDDTDVSTIVQDVKDLLASLEYDERSLEIGEFEGVEFSYNGDKYNARKLSIDDFLSLDKSTFETDTLSLTDGKSVYLYTDETNWYVYNESANVAFAITAEASVMAKIRAKARDVSFLENVRHEFEMTATKLMSLVNDLSEGWRNDIKALEKSAEELEQEIMIKLGKSAAKGNRVAEIERQIEELKLAQKNGFRQMDLRAQQIALQQERTALLNEIDGIGKEVNAARSQTKSLRVKAAGFNAMLCEVLDYIQIVDELYTLGRCVGTAIGDHSRWTGFIDTILPCPEDNAKAQSLKKLSEDNRGSALRGYIGAFGLSTLSAAISIAAKASGKPAGWIMKFFTGVLTGSLLQTAKDIYEKTYEESHMNLNKRISDRAALKCKKDDDYKNPIPWPDDPTDKNNKLPRPDGGNHGSGNTDSKYGIDPSGYVYEAVPSNRVPGVQASIYYKETKEDMYGDPYEEIVLWDAEEYAQENPLFTDENGMYQWDVPQGLWQVKFEKEGYITTQSDWLPVPPPQLDVNVAITQNRQPEITEARAYETGVEVQFDKFMRPSTLNTDNILLSVNGVKVQGEVTMLDDEVSDPYIDEEDVTEATERYVSRVRFVPAEPLSMSAGEVRLTVNRNVLSYAGIPMTQTYSQTLDLEKEVTDIVADNIKVLYGGEKELTIHALPFDASANRVLHIGNASDLIATIDKTEVQLDDEGKGVITVKGEIPGRTQLMFSIDDVTATGSAIVDVVTELVNAEKPTATRASGTAVYRGTKVALATDSKDGVIYFTTDGSCPCDENGTRRKYTVPIVIDKDVEISAVTVVGDGDDDMSEISTFTYTLKQNILDLALEEGWNWVSHSMESNVAPSDLSTDSNVNRILSQNHETVNDPVFGFIGTLTELTPTESYKVEASTAKAPVRLTDVAWNPATPIDVKAGWNWIGYPVSQTMTVAEALEPTETESLDYIVGRNGFAQYDGENWIGTLATLVPGEGYMFQSQSDKKIVYNTSIVSKAASLYAPGITAKTPVMADSHKYPQVMCMVAEIYDTESGRLGSDDYLIAAFSGSECRGIGKVVNDMVMMNIYGNAGDDIAFRAIDADDKAYDIASTIRFSETMLGDIFTPYQLTMSAPNSVNAIDLTGGIRVVVNHRNLKVRGINAADVDNVSLFDTDGRKMLSTVYPGNDGIAVDRLEVGTYLVIVKSGNSYTYHKVLVK